MRAQGLITDHGVILSPVEKDFHFRNNLNEVFTNHTSLAPQFRHISPSETQKAPTTIRVLRKVGGTQGRTRTGTPVKAGDFESPASTIPPLGHWV